MQGKYTIITSSNSRTSGGLCGAVSGFTKAANATANRVDLVSYNDEYSSLDWHLYGNTVNCLYNVSNLPILSRFGYSPDLADVLNLISPKVIDVQGLWMYHSYAAFRYQKKHPSVKKVMTPHGMLDPWAINNSRWKKKIVGHLFEYENLRTADCFHALCKSEYESIRQLGLHAPVAIIPNGIDLPEKPQFDRNKSKKVILYISRIHPKKGLKEMIEGIARLKEQSSIVLSNWTFRIAGWNQLNHQEELHNLAKNLGVDDDISFLGPVFGEDKEKELCQADAFILPSFSEGLPMSILEAWAYQLPCVMTDFCNLPEGFKNNAAIRIEPNSTCIANGLMTLMNLSDAQRIEMGINGYNLCKNSFSWQVVAEMKVQMYKWLLGEGEKPDFVYCD